MFYHPRKVWHVANFNVFYMPLLTCLLKLVMQFIALGFFLLLQDHLPTISCDNTIPVLLASPSTMQSLKYCFYSFFSTPLELANQPA